VLLFDVLARHTICFVIHGKQLFGIRENTD